MIYTASGSSCVDRPNAHVGRDKQKNFRLATSEDRKIQKAARASGLTDSQWIRLIVLAALGETNLLEQLTRAAGAKVGAVAKKRGRSSRKRGADDVPQAVAPLVHKPRASRSR